MLGGALVGLLAMVSPQVMSSGHGALHLTGIFKLPLETIALIFVLKALASIVSLGTGFRGGLFFASLLLGALGGQLFAVGLNAVVAGVARRSRRLCHHRHGRPVGLGDRRAADHDLHRAGDHRRPLADHRGADRGDHLDAGDARILRLFLHHLALPSARRDHPQRRRCRLDPGSDGRPDDALGRAHDAGGDADRGLSRGLSARLDQPGDRGGRGRPLRRHGDRGGSARGGTACHRLGARYPAPRRPYAAAANDGAGGDLGVRPLTKRKRSPWSTRPSAGRSSACSAKRMRCAAIPTLRNGSGGELLGEI